MHIKTTVVLNCLLIGWLANRTDVQDKDNLQVQVGIFRLSPCIDMIRRYILKSSQKTD